MVITFDYTISYYIDSAIHDSVISQNYIFRDDKPGAFFKSQGSSLRDSHVARKSTSPITFPDIPFIKTVFSMLPSKVSSPEVLIHESETDTVFFESTPLAPSAPDAFTILFVISTFSCEKTATSLVDMASAQGYLK